MRRREFLGMAGAGVLGALWRPRKGDRMPVTTVWTTLTYGGSGLRWTDAGNFPNTSPGSIGNGTLRLQYKRTGGICYVRLYMLIGSTTALPGVNGGLWAFELPTDVAPDTSVVGTTLSGGDAFPASGTMWANNHNGATAYVGACGVDSNMSSGVPAIYGTFNTGVPTGANLNAAQPWSWTTGDSLAMAAFFPALDN